DSAQVQEVVARVDAPVIVDVEADLEAELGGEGEFVVLVPADVARQGEQAAGADLGRLAGDEERGRAVDVEQLVHVAGGKLDVAGDEPAAEDFHFAFEAELDAVEAVAGGEVVVDEEAASLLAGGDDGGTFVDVDGVGEIDVAVGGETVGITAVGAAEPVTEVGVRAPEAGGRFDGDAAGDEAGIRHEFGSFARGGTAERRLEERPGEHRVAVGIGIRREAAGAAAEHEDAAVEAPARVARQPETKLEATARASLVGQVAIA